MKSALASIGHWLFVAIIFLITVPLVILVSFGIIREFVASREAVFVAVAVGLVVGVFMLIKCVPSDAGSAEWTVDDLGFQSPTVGRCERSDVVAAYRGFPGSGSFTRLIFQEIIARGSRGILDETIVVRAKDGRLLAINLLSPGITGGGQVMKKISDRLSGKIRPLSELTPAEVRALRGLTLNRWIKTANAQRPLLPLV